MSTWNSLVAQRVKDLVLSLLWLESLLCHGFPDQETTVYHGFGKKKPKNPRLLIIMNLLALVKILVFISTHL